MKPAEIAAEALGLTPADIALVEPIKHGLTNESWLVRSRDEAVIVRLSNASTESLQIDRMSEATVLSSVAAAGIGARVLLNDPVRQVLVTRYVGEPWSLQDARMEPNVRSLAARLQQLHQLRVPVGVRAVELGRTVRGYLATLDRHQAGSELTMPDLREAALDVVARLQGKGASCLCHNDVHHLNVVGREQPLLIDWEYAGRGDPAFDLASVCVYHAYEAELREILLDAYASHGQPVDAERLRLACWLFEYVRDLWMAVREVSAKSASETLVR
jgi:thiamine kinase